MSAIEVIKELEELPSQEREKVLRWLQQQGLKDLWARADALMKDAPRLNEDEILRLPRNASRAGWRGKQEFSSVHAS